MLDKVFNNSTILQNYKVFIDDLELVTEDVVSIEITHSFHDFKVTGILKLSDTYDLNTQIKLNGKNFMTLQFTDFAGTEYNKKFMITNVTTVLLGERFNVIDLELQDEISYILQNTYVSKSFDETPVKAFQKYLTHVGIDDLLNESEMTYEISDTSTKRKFVVPQHVSVLDFFIDLFKEENIRIWQTRHAFNVKKINVSEIQIARFKNETVSFSNQVLNNEYLFKIHEFVDSKFPVAELNHEKPLCKNFRYDYKKEIVDATENLSDVVSELKLNDFNEKVLQQTTGEKYSTQSFYSTGNQNYELFNTYMKSSVFNMVVPGVFEINEVGNVIDVEMKGNNIHSESQLTGDKITSGKYFVIEVKDKIIGGKFINKMTVNRLGTS